MKILQISKSDSFGGGASKLAQQLALALREEGHYVQHRMSWVGRPYDYDMRWPLYGRFEKIIRTFHYGAKKMGIVEYIPFELPIMLKHAIIKNFEILHFHDLSSAISPFTLAFFARRMPVIWTIHDCSPFTGGCLYPMDCKKFKKSCGNCPQAGLWPIDSWFDTTYLGNRIKRIVHKSGVNCITPSRYMSQLAASSGMFTDPPQVIPNGIDTTLYSNKVSKDALRVEMGVPLQRPVILLSAGHLEDHRKGIQYSIEAVKAIGDLNPFLIILGAAKPDFFSLLEGLDYLVSGYLDSASSLSKYYGCADLFLFCSLADNQPLAVMEAMSCGTPVVGFKTGGIPEMVEKNKTGVLVERYDMPALTSALRAILETKSVYRWPKAARKKAVTEYSIQKCTERHIALYKTVLKNWRKKHQKKHEAEA